MSPLVALAVGLLGGLGAILRFALDGAIAGWLGRAFPYGTFVVNISGAFALGVAVGTALAQDTYRLVGTALIGAFTTFSTWTLESHRLGEDGELMLGALNLALSLAAGLAAAWAGRHLGAAL